VETDIGGKGKDTLLVETGIALEYAHPSLGNGTKPKKYRIWNRNLGLIIEFKLINAIRKKIIGTFRQMFI
jgi:hypothetical protein